MADAGCGEVRDLLPEVALGIAEPGDRAAALAHADGCAPCRDELRRLSDTADGLAALAPPVAPSSGFAGRTVAGLGTARAAPARTRRRPWHWAAAAGVAAAVTAGAVAWATVGGPAAPRRAVLTGQLVEAGHPIGDVVLVEAARPHISVHVQYGAASGTIRCEVVDAGGRVVPVGTFSLNGGWGSWTTAVPAGGRPTEALLTSPSGAVLARAVLAPAS
ncbi:MAG: zf-HC2 domain-containing protein [Acidimicrobiales bacterium]